MISAIIVIGWITSRMLLIGKIYIYAITIALGNIVFDGGTVICWRAILWWATVVAWVMTVVTQIMTVVMWGCVTNIEISILQSNSFCTTIAVSPVIMRTSFCALLYLSAMISTLARGHIWLWQALRMPLAPWICLFRLIDARGSNLFHTMATLSLFFTLSLYLLL
jgi:hypothetical protein